MFRYLLVMCSMLWAAPASAGFDWWEKTLEAAKGQTVYWNAWGGSAQYNDYIAWVGKRVAEDYGVMLEHVRLSDTADAVRTVLAEKQAGTEHGSIDLIWINGANFHAMKEANLLYEQFAEELPNFDLVHPDKNPATIQDFGIPTEGYESPWGMARFNFIYDSARIQNPPRSAMEFLKYARKNPGRLSHPFPADFTGMAFLKQVLLELSDSDPVLYAPVQSEAFDKVIPLLWDYIDALEPYLWREGKDFPANEAVLLELLKNNAVDMAMSYNSGAASSAIAYGDLPKTVRSFAFDAGTLGNVDFVTIPFNSPSPEGAMVVANFLLSPEAQAMRQNPKVWGDYTVLDLDSARLTPEDKALFDALPTLSAQIQNLGKVLPELHPSWTEALRQWWVNRRRNGLRFPFREVHLYNDDLTEDFR